MKERFIRTNEQQCIVLLHDISAARHQYRVQNWVCIVGRGSKCTQVRRPGQGTCTLEPHRLKEARLLVEAIEDGACIRVGRGGGLLGLLGRLDLRGHCGVVQGQHPVQDFCHTLSCRHIHWPELPFCSCSSEGQASVTPD